MPRTRIATTTSDWELLIDSVTPEVREGVTPLEIAHGKLLRFIEEVRELVRERDFYEARKQEATRKLQQRLASGRKVATMMRMVLKYHLGHDNETLTRFGIKPSRAGQRRRTSKKTSKAEGPSAPEETPT